MSIRYALNKPEDFFLAIVEVHPDGGGTPRYINRPFRTEPDFGEASVNSKMNNLLRPGPSLGRARSRPMPVDPHLYIGQDCSIPDRLSDTKGRDGPGRRGPWTCPQ